MSPIEKAEQALKEAEGLVEQKNVGGAVDKALEAQSWAAVAAQQTDDTDRPVRVMNDVSGFVHMLAGE